MTIPAITRPDVELVVLGFLRAEMTARLVTDLPGDLEAHLPLVQVTRIGGAAEFVVDAARVDLDFYAGSRTAAADVAAEARALLPTMPNRTLFGAVVTDVAEEVAPSWRPDWNPNVRRFGGTYLIALRPA